MWYIDSDNIIRVEGLRNVVTDAYVNDATITGILYELPALNPDAGAATDESDGKVGIPFAGHTLENGDSIRLERGSNYNGDYVLQAETTGTDILVITATFVTGSTFTGDEFIYTAIVGTADVPITFSYEDASDGNYVGKVAYTEALLQGEDYVMCIKEVSGAEQVLAKIVHTAGFHGL